MPEHTTPDTGIRLDPETRQIHGPAGTATLTGKEYALLDALISAHGAVVSRQELLTAAWDTTWVGASRALDVHIATLRTKLGTTTDTRIHTVRGAGYRLSDHCQD